MSSGDAGGKGKDERARRWAVLGGVTSRLGIAACHRERVIDETTIDEAARRIADACPPGTRVFLFGSHARGEAGKHSDLDFLVIEPEVENATEGVCAPAKDAVWSAARGRRDHRERAEGRDWRDVKGSLIHPALAEGRELIAV